jgi:carbohydrate kinase (thermoresistant glucokinase family)
LIHAWALKSGASIVSRSPELVSLMSDTTARAVILMGVAGSGKSTVDTNLAKRLDWTFLDADDFHPAANVEKMSNGIPLNDGDRMPWLRRLHDELEHRLGSGASVVLGCSALKESYRQIMQEGLSRIDFVFLDVDQLTLTERLGKREAHFFPKGLLESQFAALERPQDALIVDASRSIEELVEQIVAALDEKAP